MLRQTVAQLLETPQIGTVELPWVPCSPPALGRELSLALLSRKAGRTPQHTGLGTWGAVRKQDSTNGGHSCSLKSPPPPPPPMCTPAPPPAHPMHCSCTQPGAQAREAGAHWAAACSACLASHPFSFPLNLRPGPSSLHPHMAARSPQHHRPETGCPGRTALGRGVHGILRSPSQTHGGWGRESLGSPCPPWVMNELTIGY